MAMLRPVKAAARVEYRPWRPPWWGIVVVGAGVAGVVLGLLVSAFSPRGALSGYEYHLWKWQADTFLGTVFSVAGIGPDPGETAGDESLLAYFRLTSQIRAATDTGEPDLALVETLENERATYENDVERTIEQT